jgi:hypothetical protein
MNDWVGLTIAEVLERCRTSYEDLEFVDEPPGKLRALEFNCRQTGQPKKVVVEIAPCPELFSAERSWPRTLVLAQKVTGVLHPPGEKTF